MANYKDIKGFKVQYLAQDPLAASSWTSGGTMTNTRFNLGGSGTQTAALGTAGAPRATHGTKTEEKFYVLQPDKTFIKFISFLYNLKF